ncbi:MAG: efflux RND transporter permease subunit, partial [bacterium]
MREAIVEGAAVRLRPILMTSITTVIALVPLALGWGKGSEMLRPLGIVVSFGLSLSTFVILFLTPSLYEVVHNGVAVLRRWVGLPPRKFAPREAEEEGAVLDANGNEVRAGAEEESFLPQR